MLQYLCFLFNRDDFFLPPFTTFILLYSQHLNNDHFSTVTSNNFIFTFPFKIVSTCHRVKNKTITQV